MTVSGSRSGTIWYCNQGKGNGTSLKERSETLFGGRQSLFWVSLTSRSCQNTRGQPQRPTGYKLRIIWNMLKPSRSQSPVNWTFPTFLSTSMPATWILAIQCMRHTVWSWPILKCITTVLEQAMESLALQSSDQDSLSLWKCLPKSPLTSKLQPLTRSTPMLDSHLSWGAPISDNSWLVIMGLRESLHYCQASRTWYLQNRQVLKPITYDCLNWFLWW